MQANADVQAQAAAINSQIIRGDRRGSQLQIGASGFIQQQANLEKAKLDWERGQGLYKDGLIPKQDFDQRKRPTTRLRRGGFLQGANAVAKSANGSDALDGQPEQSGAGAHQGYFAQDRLTCRPSTGS